MMPAGPKGGGSGRRGGVPSRFLLTPFFLDRPEPGLRPLAGAGWEVHEGALPAGQLLARLAARHAPIARWVAEAVASGRRPVSLAGDCVAAIPVLAGLQRAGVDPLLVWFDAHGDFNTFETTPSGFLGGMPLAMLVGRGEQALCRAVGVRPLPEEQVILTDARDLDRPGEAAAVTASQIAHLPRVGLLVGHQLEQRPIWVHFDTDVLRPEDAPAQNYLAPGGPSPDELAEVFERLCASGRVVAVSVSCWNPALDVGGATARVCLDLLSRLLGEEVAGCGGG